MHPLQFSCLRQLRLMLAIYHPVIMVASSHYNHMAICEIAHKTIFLLIFDFIVLVTSFLTNNDTKVSCFQAKNDVLATDKLISQCSRAQDKSFGYLSYFPDFLQSSRNSVSCRHHLFPRIENKLMYSFILLYIRSYYSAILYMAFSYERSMST